MKTTAEWLHEIKTVPGKMEAWLERQYIGEMIAAHRIGLLASSLPYIAPAHWVLAKIAQDEADHAAWVSGLLLNRGMDLPVVTDDGVRYWEPILGVPETFEEICAAGHHAEEMRLVRIRALVEDQDLPLDIRDVFARILTDEEFHASAFETLSTPEAIERMRPYHEAGLEALGLAI